MFSLIKFHNDAFSVVKSKDVQMIDKSTCIVKCGGGKYSGFYVTESDDKTSLIILKKRNEESNQGDRTFNNNTRTSQNSSLTNNTEKSLLPENLSDISSILGDISSFSEYIPDISAETSKETFENSRSIIEKNESIVVVDVPLNVKEIAVPYSKTKTKKHFCIFCKTLQCKIARHFFFKHKNEEEVKKASVLPKKCKERLKIIDKLRKEGNFLHNTSANYNSGVLIVSRQQQSQRKYNVDDYICCKKCKGFFSKRTSRNHISVCGKSKGKRGNFIESRRLTQYMHSAANKTLRTIIFPVLRNDETTKSIRYDELVVKFGNRQAEKYTQHQHDMIRANLRLLGRFIIELKKNDANINELKDIFKPHMFDTCLDAIRKVANWDETSVLFKTPAVAQNMTCLLKKCGKMQRAEYIKEGRENLKTEVDNFLLLWDDEIPTLINKKAIEDQTNIKRIKKLVLPPIEDIQKLNLYLKEKIFTAMENLSNIFCMDSWTELIQATLIFVQIFNRRRAGEIERLTIENFRTMEVITDNVDNNILSTMSKNAIRFSKQFVRITLRGKLGRTVSVLLCPMSVKAIEMIIKYRPEAGITSSNNNIFSKPTNSALSKEYYRACPLLKMFSQECGAQIPHSLRGTTLRKHMATYASLQNIEEASVDKLANFMGHHKDIHKSIYRMSIPVAEITCVSKLLKTAVGDDVENEDDDEEEDEEEEAEVVDDGESENSKSIESLPEKSKNSSTSSSRKCRSTSPYGKTKRLRWTNAEREAIYLIFGDLKKLKKLPSLEQCANAIRQSPALKKRTPQKIKSWIDNQKRYKTDQDIDL